MAELTEYIRLRQEIERKPALVRAIRDKEASERKLFALLQIGRYESAEAVELTNDVTFLEDMLSKNDLYRAYIKAKEEYTKRCESRRTDAQPPCNLCGGHCGKEYRNAEKR